jgi:hypothetical protein
MTVLEFPQPAAKANLPEAALADRPITEAEVDKLHSEAFRDMEGRLSDCLWMSVIALEMVEARSRAETTSTKRQCSPCSKLRRGSSSSRPTITPLGTAKSRWSRHEAPAPIT